METEEFMSKTQRDIEGEMDRLFKSDRFRSVIGELTGALEYGLEGGKRLRPTMGLAINQAFDGNYQECLEVICAVELVHQGSLMHDDIIDGDKLRRGKPTVFELFDVAKAVVGGQRLVGEAFVLGFGRGPRIVKLIAEAVSELIEGNTYDLKGPNFKEALAIKIASMKTGCLYSAAAKIGAVMARAYDRDVTNAGSYGRHVGIAFQIADDIVDVTKSAYLEQPIGDLHEGKVTLPLINLYETAGDTMRKTLAKYSAKQLLTEDEMQRILVGIKPSGCVEAALSTMNKHISEARSLVPEDISRDYRQILSDVPKLYTDSILAEVDAERWF